MNISFALLSVLTTLLFFSTPAALQAEERSQDQPASITAAPEATSHSSSSSRFLPEGEWYFSWGYSGETWAQSDIHVSQSNPNGSGDSNFTVHNVKAHDEKGWDSNVIGKGLFVPQYNIRLGRFIDDERTLAVELNLDHTKYTSTIGQTARVSGTINGAEAPSSMVLDEKNFRYNLHNGANHVMVNLMKRLPLIGKTNESLSLAGIGKVGIGLVIPHSSNTIDGKDNYVGEKKMRNFFGFHHGWWQFDGVTAGAEAGLRFVVAKPVYLELTDKVAYARMYDIPVYQGTAKQDLWMNEIILSLGFTYDGDKKVAKP